MAEYTTQVVLRQFAYLRLSTNTSLSNVAYNAYPNYTSLENQNLIRYDTDCRDRGAATKTKAERVGTATIQRAEADGVTEKGGTMTTQRAEAEAIYVKWVDRRGGTVTVQRVETEPIGRRTT